MKPFYQNNNRIYTQYEDDCIVGLGLRGKSHKKIGIELSPIFDRPSGGIKSRACKLLGKLRRERPELFPDLQSKAEPPKIATQLIRKDELPEWYMLGWHIASFENENIMLEWRHQMPPRQPVIENPAFAGLTLVA